MKLKNKTDIPNEIVKDVIRFVRPPGISKFLVVLTTKRGRWSGYANQGMILIRINSKAAYPFKLSTYQIGQLRGKRYYLASLVEALIYLFAHELVHTRQGQSGALRGRVYGARGKYSEIEAESYAIRKLREWRKSH